MSTRLEITPDVPLPSKDDTAGCQDLLVRAKAAANAARLLDTYGLGDTPTPEDQRVAAALATQYAHDPVTTSAAATPARIAKMTPAALVLTADILEQFGHEIVKDAVQVRHLVMNKLVQETENPDPRIRIRALELLGKITDVGIFTERSEVTVTHRTSDELRERLREKLQHLRDITPRNEDADDEDDG